MHMMHMHMMHMMHMHMHKKFKMHSDQMEEDMYSYDLMMPPDITFVHNMYSLMILIEETMKKMVEKKMP